MHFKPLLRLLWLVALDILAILAIFWAIVPFAKWYLSRSPAIGVDLYNSISYVSYQLRHFALPFNSFRDVWFGGYPLMHSFPQFSFYLMMPFAVLYEAALGVQAFAVFSLFLFIYCCYLLFSKLTSNWGISIFLAILVLLSINIYGGLTWAGSLPYFLSQSFFPLGLFFAIRYFDEPNAKNLGLLGLVVDFGFLIHPLGIMAYLFPSVVLLIFVGGIYASHSIIRIFKQICFFILIFTLGTLAFTGSLLLSLHHIVPRLLSGKIVTSAVGADVAQTANIPVIAQHYKSQIPLLWQHTNSLIFITIASGAGVFLIAFLFSRQKKRSLLPLTLAIIAAYCGILPVLNLSGRFGLFVHDPYRAFWQFPVATAALAAALWGFFLSTLTAGLTANKFLKTIDISLGLLISLTFGFLSFVVFTNQMSGIISTIEKDARLIEYSSAYPESLSINLQDKEGLSRLRTQLLPSFINPNEKNKRLYEADATVNIWWSSFFDVPLVRGYSDPPLTSQQRGGLFWLDIGMTGDTIMKVLSLDSETALLNTLFLIDWNGVGYFEGGRGGIKGISLPPSSYLIENKIFDKYEEVTTYGRVIKWGTVSGKPELHLDMPEKLNFYKVDDRFTSPILSATNAPAVAVFGTRAGYEDILRVLASGNINSRKLIPVWAGEFIDDFSLKELEVFDAVILNQYKYHNQGKAFGTLGKYVAAGGKVFIDSGGEVKESDSSNLPQLFPFESSERKAVGRQWEISKENDEILAGVNIGEFGPLIFNDDDWKLTTPVGDLRTGSKVILAHRDKPVLVKMDYGQGKVVWSGINLPYHYSQYKKNDEAKIFINALAQFTDVSDHEPQDVGGQWIRPEKITAKIEGKPRGILFKEEGYSGWRALLRQGSGGQAKNLPIYLAGPTYPGFMYVPLRNWSGSGPATFEFSYSGKLLYKVQTFVNIAAVIFILEFAIFDGRIFGKRTLVVTQKIGGKLFKWWEKEDEE